MIIWICQHFRSILRIPIWHRQTFLLSRIKNTLKAVNFGTTEAIQSACEKALNVIPLQNSSMRTWHWILIGKSFCLPNGGIVKKSNVWNGNLNSKFYRPSWLSGYIVTEWLYLIGFANHLCMKKVEIRIFPEPFRVRKTFQLLWSMPFIVWGGNCCFASIAVCKLHDPPGWC